MKRIALLLAGVLALGLAAAQTTVTVPLTVTVKSPTTTAPGQVSVVVGASTTNIPIPAVNGPTPPPPPPPPSGVLWVYQNGALGSLWTADWSWNGSAKYKDTTGIPLEGPFDIQFTATSYNGGWQPAIGACQTSLAACLNVAPYKYIILSIKPTVNGQDWNMGFMSAGDTPDGSAIDIAKYCGTSVVGAWNSCKVPLSAFGLTNLMILKFMVQGNTQGATKWYMDDVGFSP